MGFWKNILPSIAWNPLNEIRRDYFPNKNYSYSGEGEDLILSKIFNNKKNGFYVDIGCYHPKINSNTYYFYKRGWHGINIDANPDSIVKFQSLRKRDMNVTAGIAEQQSTLSYYTFSEPAINTFSKSLCEERKEIPWLTFLGEKKVMVEPLRDVLDRMNITFSIDIMDIDVEGYDMQVLRSNNWDKYLPHVVLVEDQNAFAHSFEELETFRYLIEKGYKLIAKTFSTLIFIHMEYLKTIE